MTGISFNEMPGRDAVSHVDFDEAPRWPSDERNAWMRQAIADVAYETSVVEPALDPEDEEGTWQVLEDRVNAAGFDTYNSDSYFEVYAPENPEVA